MTDVLVEAFHPKLKVTRIHPGPVGVVGDVLCQTRLKHSNPDLPLRWEAWNSGANEIFLGSNIQDGYKRSYVSSGRQGRVYEYGGKRMSTRKGIVVQDLNSNTNMMEPQVGSLGDYDWRSKQAAVYESNRTGFKFLPLPYGYRLPYGQVPRAGGPVTSITDGVISNPPIQPPPAIGRPIPPPPTTGKPVPPVGKPVPPKPIPEKKPKPTIPGGWPDSKSDNCQKPSFTPGVYRRPS